MFPRIRLRRIAVLAVPLLAALLAHPSPAALAADRTKLDEVVKFLDGARAAEADVFAPKAWAKASERLAAGRALLDQGGRQQEADKILAQAREYGENAIKAAEVCKLSLKGYLDPRERARAAKAPALVPEAYAPAEQKFVEATSKVEGGDVKGGLKKAAEAAPLFVAAEDAAIRVTVLGAADKLIATAVADEAAKYAPSTLDAARTARQRAADALTRDRYDRTESVEQAARAEYEARHASYIAMSVRSLNRNDQAWEKLMLLYEIQMNRIGQKMGREYLPFDNGPIAAADSIVAFIGGLEGETARTRGEKEAASARLSGQMQELRGDVTQQMQQVLARLSVTSQSSDPGDLARLLDEKVAELVAERAAQGEKLRTLEQRLAELTAAHRETSAELQARQAKEERFASARQTINPSEGEILLNANGDVVLRLSGLSFDPGRADIKDAHVPLLQKVEDILKLYPGASYVVEGHTDGSGEALANQQLSEKRAFALMQYLRQDLSIPADHIRAIGYGAERPIAPNTTPQGRAKNRRIDILILQ